MKGLLSLKPLRLILLSCLLIATANVAEADTPSKYSTTWTTSNNVYLYNKATGLYLATDGHWGTEGMLKATGMPVYISKANSTAGDVEKVALYSNSDKSKKWGLLTSAETFDPIKNGFYCDASDQYPAQTFSFKYNSDDETYSIYRDGITADNIAISFTSPSGVKYYLAPSTGSITTLIWSTAPYFWAYDSSSKFAYAVDGSNTSNTGTKYYLYHENNGQLKVSSTYNYASTCIIDDEGYLRVGNGEYYLTYGGVSLTTSKPSAAATASIYKTSTSNVYLCQQGGTGARQNIVTELICSGTIPDAARWYIVTKADMIADFENATASEAQPKEASFYLANPDLSRNVELGWTLTDDDKERSYATLPYTRFGNALYNYAGPTHSTNSNGNNGVENLTTGAVKTTEETATLGANGSGYTVTDDDVQYAGIAAGQTTYYHAIYGGYYNVRMLSNGTSNARKMYQELTGLKAGYYKFSCDGYVYNPSGADGMAYLYAKTTDDAGKSNVSVALAENDTYENMTQAGINFYNNGHTSDYRSSVVVYVPEGATLELGVSVSGGVFSDAAQGNANTFAEVDGFKLEYTGNPTYDILLDEENNGTATYSSENLNYINAQVAEGARTLYLKRAMVANQWNSLVLPVSITAGALKTAFGENAELVAFKECNGNTITFNDVTLSDDAKDVVEAGKCYLIKPSVLNCQISGTYSVTLAKDATTSIEVEASTSTPVFTFNQVSLTNEVTTPSSSDKFTPTTDEDITDGLQFMGTYFYTTDAIGYGSYAINAADGNWYRYTGSSKVTVKGFRTWIGCIGEKITNSPAKLTMFINGEEFQPTDVAGLTVESEQPTGRVYNINGQYVGNAENVSNLPKGLYIVGGKKYIIK